MGQDERQRQERARVLRQDFGAGVAQGVIAPLDRFGQPLQAGQAVLYRPPYDLLCTITGVTPILDPRAPAGMAQLELTVTIALPVPVRQALPMFVVVGQVATPATPVEPPSGGIEPVPAIPPADTHGRGRPETQIILTGEDQP